MKIWRLRDLAVRESCALLKAAWLCLELVLEPVQTVSAQPCKMMLAARSSVQVRPAGVSRRSVVTRASTRPLWLPGEQLLCSSQVACGQ